MRRRSVSVHSPLNRHREQSATPEPRLSSQPKLQRAFNIPGRCRQCYCSGLLQLLPLLFFCELFLCSGSSFLLCFESLLQLAHSLFVLLFGLDGIMEPTQTPKNKPVNQPSTLEAAEAAVRPPLTCSAAARSPGATGPARSVWSARCFPVSRSDCAGPARPAGWPAGRPLTSSRPAPICSSRRDRGARHVVAR